jgi:radical SAM superfamily enzyme YgiQ (UPF0313 family)
MGLGYIASYLKHQGISVDILDCDAEGVFIDFFSPSNSQEVDFEERIKPYKNRPPLMVGIGPCTTPFMVNCLAIARLIKKILPTSFLIIGGPHVSITPPVMATRMLTEFEYIDGICINEGELTTYELQQELSSKGFVKNVTGLVTRMSSGGFSYEKRKLSSSNVLNGLPYPNRDLIVNNPDKYKQAIRRSFAKINKNQQLQQKYGKNPLFTPIFSSRGCPYSCSFCCSLNTRRIRTAENVVQEMVDCVNLYNIHCFIFYDDLFTTSSPVEIDRVRTICNKLLKLDIEVFWEVELRADVIVRLGKEILTLMYEAGCCTVNMGIEKASDDALSIIDKKLSIIEIKEAISLLNDSGNFVINGTFILGGPRETKDDIDKLIEFSKHLGIDYAAYYPLEIHPGTKVFKEAQNNGLVNDMLSPYVQRNRNYPVFTNSMLSGDDLTKLQCKAYQEFYMNTDKIKALINKVGSVYDVYEQYKHFFEHAFVEGTR